MYKEAALMVDYLDREAELIETCYSHLQKAGCHQLLEDFINHLLLNRSLRPFFCELAQGDLEERRDNLPNISMQQISHLAAFDNVPARLFYEKFKADLWRIADNNQPKNKVSENWYYIFFNRVSSFYQYQVQRVQYTIEPAAMPKSN